MPKRKRAHPVAPVEALQRFDRPIDAINFIVAQQANNDLAGLVLATVGKTGRDGGKRAIDMYMFGDVTNRDLTWAGAFLTKIGLED